MRFQPTAVDVTDAGFRFVSRPHNPRKRSINGDPGNGLSFPERVSENRPKARTFVLVAGKDERDMDC
jgi:hypothetical protein